MARILITGSSEGLGMMAAQLLAVRRQCPRTVCAHLADRAAEPAGLSEFWHAPLAFAIARRWKNVLSNALEPGWVPTRMGGPGEPDDMDQAHRTQVWLATSEESDACVSGGYFYHKRPRAPNPQAQDVSLQDRLIAACEQLSSVALPE